MTGLRILVTGSRRWANRLAIAYTLHSLVVASGAGDDVVVIHGAQTGADRIADGIATAWGWRTEPHLARWYDDCLSTCTHLPRFDRNGNVYCPAAGNYRNQLMVDRGADFCAAFPLRDSVGTPDCVKRARRAGIRIVEPPVGKLLVG